MSDIVRNTFRQPKWTVDVVEGIQGSIVPVLDTVTWSHAKIGLNIYMNFNVKGPELVCEKNNKGRG